MVQSPRTALIISFLGLLSAVGRVPAQGQGDPYSPGDLAIYVEDLSGTPPGQTVEGWEILGGSYEAREFQGRRWFWPIAFDTHLLRRMNLPREFSIEFTTYLFEPGNAELRVFLHSPRDLERGPGSDGPAQVYLTVARYGETDGLVLRVWDPTTRQMQVVVDQKSFAPDTPHRIRLVLRAGRLYLAVDEKALASRPFQPQEPLTALSFRFLSRGGHELPYRERPALLDGIRIATYTMPAGQVAGGMRLYFAMPVPTDSLRPFFGADHLIQSDYLLNALRRRYGWQQVTLVSIPLFASPFEARKTTLEIENHRAESLVKKLLDGLPLASRLGGGILIVGDGGDGGTELERRLLAGMRSAAFGAWLVRQGIGNPDSLLDLLKEIGSYESYYLDAKSGRFMGAF